MIDFEQIIIPTIASRFKRLRYNEVRTLAPEIISYGQKSAILKLEKAGVPKSGNFNSIVFRFNRSKQFSVRSRFWDYTCGQC